MPDCQKACPLADACLAKIVQGILPAGAVPARFGIAVALMPGNDVRPGHAGAHGRRPDLRKPEIDAGLRAGWCRVAFAARPTGRIPRRR